MVEELLMIKIEFLWTYMVLISLKNLFSYKKIMKWEVFLKNNNLDKITEEKTNKL